MAGIYIRGEHEPELKTEILFKNLTTGESLTIKNVMPENFSVGPSTPEYSPVNIIGRSSPVKSYSGGGERTVGFTLSLHRDLFEGGSEKAVSDAYQKALDFFDALNYPKYTGSGVVPPQAYCKIMKTTNIKGYVSVGFTFKKPIDRYGRYICADVQFEFTEILNESWDVSEILDGCVSRKEVSESR